MRRSFTEKLKQAQEHNETDVALLLRPLMSEMPAPMHYRDDPFFPFSKAIVSATRDIVCGYVFDFAAYMAHGAAGAVALERSLAFTGADVVKILHGAFVGGRYIEMVYENAFGADAATIASQRDYEAFTAQASHGAFIIKEENVHDVDLPIYWIERDMFTLPNGTKIRLAGESVLYASYQDDYAEQCRAALEAMR
jgi:hypothetical protein